MREALEEEALHLINDYFGEIYEPVIEDDVVTFEVYRGPYEDAPQVIFGAAVRLDLEDKFDDRFFTLAYRVSKQANWK